MASTSLVGLDDCGALALGGGIRLLGVDVTGNPAPLEIWHPRVKFPRELGILAVDLAPPCIPGNLASPE